MRVHAIGSEGIGARQHRGPRETFTGLGNLHLSLRQIRLTIAVDLGGLREFGQRRQRRPVDKQRGCHRLDLAAGQSRQRKARQPFLAHRPLQVALRGIAQDRDLEGG